MLTNTDELSKWSRYEEPAEIEEWLQSNGCHFYLDANDRPITTLAAINEAMHRPDALEEHPANE